MNSRNTMEFSPRGSGAVFSSAAAFSSSFCRCLLGTSPTPMAARMLSIEMTSSGQAYNAKTHTKVRKVRRGSSFLARMKLEFTIQQLKTSQSVGYRTFPTCDVRSFRFSVTRSAG